MEITATLVKELREKTGVGMMECKSALTESKGDLAAAEKILRTKGLAAAAKKSARATAEGAIGCYIHAGGKLGVMVEVNCETDFVARTDQFQALLKDIAMHIAAANPRFVSRGEVTPEVLESERSIYSAQAAATGKPAAVIEKIVEGKLEKYYEEFCLLEQPFVKDQETTVGGMISSLIAKIGENVRVRRFARFQLGEEPGTKSE